MFETWTNLGAADTPPCDPGWVAVKDDSGNATCVQPATGDNSYCPTGQTVFIDSTGSPVCYPSSGSKPVAPVAAGGGASYNIFSSAGWSGLGAFIQTPAGIAAALALLFLVKKKW